jgi:hypothetical protein
MENPTVIGRFNETPSYLACLAKALLLQWLMRNIDIEIEWQVYSYTIKELALTKVQTRLNKVKQTRILCSQYVEFDPNIMS